MTSPNVPRNAYTDAPEQHLNLIIGSLQLLWWIIFHPSAFRNHLTRIDPDLKPDSSLLILIRKKRWRNLALWRLLIQGHLILPVLANLPLGLILWRLNLPLENIGLWLAFVVAFSVVVSVAFGITSSVVVSVAVGLTEAVGVAVGLRLDVILSVAVGVAVGVASALAVDSVSDIISGVSLGILWGFIWDSITVSVASVMAVTIKLWLPMVIYPFLTIWNTLLYKLDKKRTSRKASLLRWHSAFWYEWQPIPLYGLDKHIFLVSERYPNEGLAVINYLTKIHYSRIINALFIKLTARTLERCVDIEAISKAHCSLVGIDELISLVSSFFSSFSHISQDVDAALHQPSAYNQRLALSAVAEKLNGLIRELTHSSKEDAVRFRPIATHWHQIVTNHIRELAKTVELRQEIDNPYIIGVPLTEQQEIFIGRTDIGTRIEQLILDRRRPPLLLYGQRRMGKTSLLNNLGRLLPNSIIPMFVDLQGPVSSASDYAGFLYNIARAMIDSAQRQSAVTLPPLTRETLAVDPFTCFDEWLDKVEQTLDQNIALLSLDEFEALDDAISKGRFDEQDVLGMLRHLIQHRPRFKLLLAGSHTIEEFQRWASYLINVQVLHISYLKEPEARQLIERPVKDFTLRYEPDAVERVLQLTRCHPFLVQLLCAEIIYLKNEQDPSVRRLATLADVEAAVPAALSSGSFFFADIQSNQVGAGLAVLRFIAAQGEGATVSREVLSRQFATSPPTPLLQGEGSNIIPPFPRREGGLGGLGQSYLDTTLELLLRRELIEEIGEGYRFQVELIRCWFVGK